MKVCYVTHQPNMTGASQSLLDIVSNWEGTDVEPVVLLRKEGPLVEELRKRNIRYKIIRYTTSSKSRKHGWKDIIRRVINKIAVCKIKNFFEQEKFDVIHNNTLFVCVGMEAALKAQIPYVCHLREFGWEDQRTRFMNEKRQHYLINNAKTAICISNAIRKKYVSLAKDVPYITIYNGIDAKRFYQEHKAIFSEEEVNILLAGRIAPGKGQFEAVQAAKILVDKGFKNFNLYIVGGVDNVEYDSKNKEYAKEHGLTQIQFLKFMDLKELRAKCDIGLICSTNEAMGRVTIESMLSGCLTIGADAAATSELIDNEKTGLLYESGNPQSLADCILKAYDNKMEMQRIAKEGQAYAVDKFDVKKYNLNLRKIYSIIAQNDSDSKKQLYEMDKRMY
ncbi:MAG: glycosyltransferase family 4 protein [Lachnospiraceae bacterium]|nr:glycosyltransferase family 4 protein [Lachnospiraceae bacterium]